MKRKKYTHVTVDFCKTIRKLYESGVNSPALGRRYQISLPRVRWCILRAGGKMRHVSHSSRYFSDEECKEVLSEYKTGANTGQLAKLYSVSTSCIRKAIHRAGGKFRSRNERRKHKSRRFAYIYQIYGLTESQYWEVWDSQQGLCYYCLSPIPHDSSCNVDHYGGKRTWRNKKHFRGLCCPHGWCNVFAGYIEKYPQENIKGLLSPFYKNVKRKLSKRYF